MCERNEDLQKEWKPKWGDHFTGIAIINSGENELEGGIYTIGYCEDGWYSVYPKGMDIEMDDNLSGKPNGAFWLLTLEQLFDIVGDYKKQISRVFMSIMVMKKYKFDSIQELVLNAVMEIKYHEIWTGKEWIIQK